MGGIEVKAQFSVTDEGRIEGIAWPFGSPDRVGDVIEKGAFAGVVPPLPILASHADGDAVGVWDEITETAEGLAVKGRLLVNEVARAKEICALTREGALRGLSIGFKTLKALPRKGGGQTITKLELLEISVVAVPAHPGARITSSKGNSMTGTTPEEKAGDLAIEALTAKMTEIEKKADPAPLLAPLVARLDKLEAKANRPGGTEEKTDDAAERKAFINFLQTGTVEGKALTTAADTANHVLAPEQIEAEFIRNLVEYSPIRAIADVRGTTAGNVILPRRAGVTNAVWVGETTTRTESEPTFGQSEIATKELATFVDISLRLVEDSANVLSEVNLALAEDFGQKESLAFVAGSTALEPSGFMADADIGAIDAASATIVNPDELIAMMYALPATYRNAGTWVMNGTTLAHLRTLKDGDGRYLWQPSYQAGQPETILGRPVVEAIDMPDIATGEEPIIFGDFKRGYRIYDRLSLGVLPDPYSQRTGGMMRYHARRRVGAGVVRPDAFRKLAMA